LYLINISRKHISWKRYRCGKM